MVQTSLDVNLGAQHVVPTVRNGQFPPGGGEMPPQRCHLLSSREGSGQNVTTKCAAVWASLGKHDVSSLPLPNVFWTPCMIHHDTNARAGSLMPV